jgi:hypothetical protein
MDPNQQKEQFSNAYLRAVAAVAGYNVYRPEVDDDSIDWGIAARGGGGTVRSPKVELQLKCTGRAEVLKDGHLAFSLKKKNYDELRYTDYQTPRILVVVLVPAQVTDWLKHSEESLVLHHCGYWVSLRGHPADPASLTVQLPRVNVFCVEQLKQMMQRIGQGGLP